MENLTNKLFYLKTLPTPPTHSLDTDSRESGWEKAHRKERTIKHWEER